MKTLIKLICTAFVLFPQFLYGQSSQSVVNTGDMFGTLYFIEEPDMTLYKSITDSKLDFKLDNIYAGYLSHDGFQFHFSTRDPETIAEKQDKRKLITSDVKLHWNNTNSQYNIKRSRKSNHYFTYGEKEKNSYGYKEISYENIYPNVTATYELAENGVHYSLTLLPGADLDAVSFTYKGDVTTSLNERNDKIYIKSNHVNLKEHGLKAYYKNGEKVKMEYSISPSGEIKFIPKQKIDKKRTLIIDPWVTPITTLPGNIANQANKGFDVDYDIAGNLYVYGGGGSSNNSANLPKIAKYSNAGVLIWTFSGIISSVPWYSNATGSYVSNFVVDKATGKIYTGQGYVPASGSRAVRLDAAGNYDNFVTTANNSFKEIWDFTFNCSNGNLIAFGGSTSSNLNFSVIDTLTAAAATQSISNATGNQQDIVCGTINNQGECFVIFNAPASSTVHEDIYKINAAYTASLWNVDCGYTTLQYNNNKQPYASVSGQGHNCLAVTDSFVYYYDGLHIKAFDEATGAVLPGAITIPGHTGKVTGGIYASECRDVYVGGNDGNILRYYYNGTTFGIVDTIYMPGVSGKRIHDLKYNAINDFLYVCGDDFVAQVNPNLNCGNVIGALQIQLTTFCPDTAIVTISNPVAGSTYAFIWTDTNTNTVVQNNTKAAGVISDTLVGFNQNSIYKVTVNTVAACQLNSSFAYVKLSCADTSINLCVGDSYTLQNNTVVTTSGLYIDTFLVPNSVDSIVKTQIFFHPPSLDTVIASICNGDAYALPGGGFASTAGLYVDSFLSEYNCDSIISTFLTVHPVYNITVNQSICAPDTFQGYSSSGQYIDTFTSVNGCDSIQTLNLTVNVATSSLFTQNICAGDTFMGYYNSGSYIDTFTNAAGCDSVRSLILTVTPAEAIFDIIPSGRDSFCIYETVAVTDLISQPAGFISWTWDWGDGATTSGMVSSHQYSAAGTYNIILTITNLNDPSCTDTALKVITIVDRNTSYFTVSDKEVCVGDPIYFTDSFSFVSSFVWDFGDNNVITNNFSPVHTYTEPGNYVVSLTTYNSVCGDSAYSESVVVNDLPLVNLGPDTSYCPGLSSPIELKNIENTSGIYSWSTGDLSSSITVTEPGRYWLFADNNGCTASDSIWVKRDCYLNIPNTFSPNGDGLNDYFIPRQLLSSGLTKFSMMIMNRWGEVVFRTENLNGRGWDGLYDNKRQPVGVYVYMIKATWSNGYSNNFTGNVTLLR